MPDPHAGERELLERWVETWQRAGIVLEEIRRQEIASIDTRKAIQQLYGSIAPWTLVPANNHSGLIEQQAWFGKLVSKRR